MGWTLIVCWEKSSFRGHKNDFSPTSDYSLSISNKVTRYPSSGAHPIQYSNSTAYERRDILARCHQWSRTCGKVLDRPSAKCWTRSLFTASEWIAPRRPTGSGGRWRRGGNTRGSSRPNASLLSVPPGGPFMTRHFMISQLMSLLNLPVRQYRYLSNTET